MIKSYWHNKIGKGQAYRQTNTHTHTHTEGEREGKKKKEFVSNLWISSVTCKLIWENLNTTSLHDSKFALSMGRRNNCKQKHVTDIIRNL